MQAIYLFFLYMKTITAALYSTKIHRNYSMHPSIIWEPSMCVSTSITSLHLPIYGLQKKLGPWVASITCYTLTKFPTYSFAMAIPSELCTIGGNYLAVRLGHVLTFE